MCIKEKEIYFVFVFVLVLGILIRVRDIGHDIYKILSFFRQKHI